MFGNNGMNTNNNSNERNVNTRIKTFYGETASLQLTYWNESISIKINPLSGVSPEGIRQYDYNRRISTALTQDKCIAIAKGVEKKILPLVDAGTEPEKTVSVGVNVGTKGSAVYIEYKKDDKGIPSLYLTVYANIDNDGKASPENTFSYKFTKTVINEDYDPSTGTTTTKTVESEFMFVYSKMKSIADAIATAAHSINVSNAYKNTGSRYNASSTTNNNNNSGGNGYAAPVENFGGDEFPF